MAGTIPATFFARKSGDVSEYLRTHKPAMLGIQTPYGKHAVVFTKYDGTYHFINPTHENSGESTELLFSEEELLSLVD